MIEQLFGQTLETQLNSGYQQALERQMRGVMIENYSLERGQLAANLFRPHPLYPILEGRMVVKQLEETLRDLRLNVLFDLTRALDRLEKLLPNYNTPSQVGVRDGEWL